MPWMADLLYSFTCMFVCGCGGKGGSCPQLSLSKSLSSGVSTVISPLSPLFSRCWNENLRDLKCTGASQLTQNLASAASTATSCLFLVFVPPRQPACFCAAIRNTSRLPVLFSHLLPHLPPFLFLTSFPYLLSLASSTTRFSPGEQNRSNRCTITKPPTAATSSPLVPSLPSRPITSPGKHTSNQ